jgi:hypothetical protein
MVIARWFPAEADKNAEQEAVARRDLHASNFVTVRLWSPQWLRH